MTPLARKSAEMDAAYAREYGLFTADAGWTGEPRDIAWIADEQEIRRAIAWDLPIIQTAPPSPPPAERRFMGWRRPPRPTLLSGLRSLLAMLLGARH